MIDGGYDRHDNAQKHMEILWQQLVAHLNQKQDRKCHVDRAAQRPLRCALCLTHHENSHPMMSSSWAKR